MKKFVLFEFAFAVIGILFFAGPFGSPPLVPSAVVTLLRYGIWGLSALLILLRLRHSLYTATRDLWVWALVGLQAVSFLWSVFPAVSQEGTREVLQMMCFGLYVASRFTLKEQLVIIAIAFNVGAVLSLVVGVAIPSVGVHANDHPGAWRGVFDYKNTLGSYMVMGAVSSLLLATDQEQPRPYAWFGFGLSILLILLSTSKTALVVAVLVLGVVQFCRNFRWRGKSAVVVIDLAMLVLSSVMILVIDNWVTLLSGLGKDPTMTGRTPMWGVMMQCIMTERPLLGFGRGAFFAGGSPYAVRAGQSVSMNFIPPHSHNGFIELALDVGVIGFVIFVISFVIAYGQAISRTYVARNSGDLWPLAFLTFLVMNNVTESYLLRSTHVYWVIYMALALSLPKRSNRVVPRSSLTPVIPPHWRLQSGD